jgi:hypothetical protein
MKYKLWHVAILCDINKTNENIIKEYYPSGSEIITNKNKYKVFTNIEFRTKTEIKEHKVNLADAIGISPGSILNTIDNLL